MKQIKLIINQNSHTLNLFIMNAKLEFLRVIEAFKLVCSTITISYSWDDGTTFNLKPGYTPEQYDKFIENLDFDYNDGYGTQHLFGTIWCQDGVWFDRHEYDGSECWSCHKYPTIPHIDLWGNDVIVQEKDPSDYYDSEWESNDPNAPDYEDTQDVEWPTK